MTRPDPRSWPPELVDERNLAMAWALGQRTDDAAAAAFASWCRRERDWRRR
jgi:hypothetical protein